MSKEKISLWKSFKRLKDFPLDVSTIWGSYEDALNYVTAKKTTAYLGQIIAVLKDSGSGYTMSEAYIVSENESGKTLVSLQSISYDLDISGYTISAGTSFTDALEAAVYILESGISESSKSGIISKDIVVKSKDVGEEYTIANAGDSITLALQKVAEFLYKNGGGGGIANIDTHDSDLKIDNESEPNKTYIDFMGITNPEYIFEDGEFKINKSGA